MRGFTAGSGGRARHGQRIGPTRARAWARRLGLGAPIAAIALACLGTSAAAVIVHLPSGATISYLRVPGSKALDARASKAPVTYHGGPVMTSNTNYTLYWDPSGAPAYPAGYQAGVDRFLEDLADDSGGLQNTDSILTQYSDEEGGFANYDSHFGGSLNDSDPYPASGCKAAPICLTDAQIRNEIVAFVEAEKLPADLQHEYFLLTPPGVEGCLEESEKSCSDGTSHPGFCAYHGYIPTLSGTIVYADDPYVAGLNCDPGEQHPNENASDATIAGGLAHEHSESVTDPELSAWYDSKGEEVADKCRTFKEKTEFGEPLGVAPDGADYNELINGDEYWYQQMWSNQTSACEQREAQLPTITKLSPKSGSESGHTSVTITGTGFAGATSVHFGALPAIELLENSPTSITAITPPQLPGTVEVTVTTSSGTSAPSKKARFKYK